MMGYYWGGYGGMMNYGFGFLGSITGIVVLIDLILVGIWLCKQIQKR